jgi:hypothetical protein
LSQSEGAAHKLLEEAPPRLPRNDSSSRFRSPPRDDGPAPGENERYQEQARQRAESPVYREQREKRASLPAAKLKAEVLSGACSGCGATLPRLLRGLLAATLASDTLGRAAGEKKLRIVMLGIPGGRWLTWPFRHDRSLPHRLVGAGCCC